MKQLDYKNKFKKKKSKNTLKMSIKCPFCPRYFSTRSAYSQHKNFCIPPPDNDTSNSEESEELELKTNDREIEVSKLYNLFFNIIINLY
jgi:hypothetical protein